MQRPESLGTCPGPDTGHVVVTGGDDSMPVLPTESDIGRGAPVEVTSDLGLSTSATQNENVPVNRRERRSVKPIDRLVVGNPTGWHFNRAKPRR